MVQRHPVPNHHEFPTQSEVTPTPTSPIPPPAPQAAGFLNPHIMTIEKFNETCNYISSGLSDLITTISTVDDDGVFANTLESIEEAYQGIDMLSLENPEDEEE